MEGSKETKRSKNFKDSEVELLLCLVDTKVDVIENKKTDSTTFKEKEAAWKVIEQDFNNKSGIYYRDMKTLKKKYENLKKTTKRKFADEKKYVLGTGGGPNQSSQITTVDYRVRELIGEVSVHGRESSFDSDARVGMQQDEDDELDILHLPVVFDEEDMSNTSVDISTSTGNQRKNSDGIVQSVDTGLEFHLKSKAGTSSGNFNEERSPIKLPASRPVFNASAELDAEPKLSCFDESGFDQAFSVKKLRSKVTSPLKFRNKKASPLDSTVAGKKIELLSMSKQEVINLQKQSLEKQMHFLEQEHELRMKCMLEEHKKKMHLLDLQIRNEELK